MPFYRLDALSTRELFPGFTARLVHTHVDSTQSLYAGMAFEWSFNPAHRDFVIEQICRCVAMIQREQAIQLRTAA